MPISPLSVFISSTCYDLGDLRYEVAESLRSNQCVVKMSEDPQSAFYVDPQDDSIQSCLRNIEGSDVVLCFIDRRYGGVLRGGDYDNKSATHVEVRHAESLKKPVFYFVRETAYRDYEQLRTDKNFKTRWVEPNNDESRSRWFSFMKETADLPEHKARSNWFDLFRFSTDLKPLVQKRLTDHFKQQFALPALQPGRIVRLSFLFEGAGQHALSGRFRNCGPGPVYNVRHGVTIAGSETIIGLAGALRDGDASGENGRPETYIFPKSLASQTTAQIFCDYENQHGDVYRVTVSAIRREQTRDLGIGREQFFVRGVDGQWLNVAAKMA